MCTHSFLVHLGQRAIAASQQFSSKTYTHWSPAVTMTASLRSGTWERAMTDSAVSLSQNISLPTPENLHWRVTPPWLSTPRRPNSLPVAKITPSTSLMSRLTTKNLLPCTRGSRTTANTSAGFLSVQVWNLFTYFTFTLVKPDFRKILKSNLNSFQTEGISSVDPAITSRVSGTLDRWDLSNRLPGSHCVSITHTLWTINWDTKHKAEKLELNRVFWKYIFNRLFPLRLWRVPIAMYSQCRSEPKWRTGQEIFWHPSFKKIECLLTFT